jgi:hypothetical protein
MDGEGQRRFSFERLHPPRVCGMVRNEGEPGGGLSGFGTQRAVNPSKLSRKIRLMERKLPTAELVVRGDPLQPRRSGLRVCGITAASASICARYVDHPDGHHRQQTGKGKSIKALEHPGLWNGAMAFWNTIFVEIPIETFNPVKTVTISCDRPISRLKAGGTERCRTDASGCEHASEESGVSCFLGVDRHRFARYGLLYRSQWLLWTSPKCLCPIYTGSSASTTQSS